MNTVKPRNKGNSLLAFPDDYVIIDVETTGYDPFYDDIIEFGAIRVRNNTPAERMQTLIRPVEPLNDYIQALTGITNDILAGAPALEDVLADIIAFIGGDVIVYAEGEHSCLTARGIKKPGTVTKTLDCRGAFKLLSNRETFLSLIGRL